MTTPTTEQRQQARAATQPWWDMLTRMENIADDLRKDGMDDAEFPVEYQQAIDVADTKIAEIYAAHGL